MEGARRGLFIVFEGLDGSGKGTQLHRAAQHVFECRKEHDVLVTREPTRRNGELRARMAASRDVRDNARWFAEVFVADRRAHAADQIEPALRYGTHVLCDRYMYSTLAYQSTQGVPIDDLVALHRGLPVPDLVLLLDVPVDIAQARRTAAGATDVFDVAALDWLQQLRDAYRSLPARLPAHPIVLVDAARPIAEVTAAVAAELDRLLSSPPPATPDDFLRVQ